MFVRIPPHVVRERERVKVGASVAAEWNNMVGRVLRHDGGPHPTNRAVESLCTVEWADSSAQTVSTYYLVPLDGPTAACNRYGCHINPRHGHCNRCAQPA